jgi:hypothetical protein
MSYFDAPIGRCEVMHTMVVTDQTEEECTREHGCPAGRVCPLGACLAHIHAPERASLTAAARPAGA